ncbi:MAG TPA: hypothetical protein VFE14_03025, partial [Micromonosporaceae bacterium]|nr:hypothetical protein [Micromonosporaceae bacterium]
VAPDDLHPERTVRARLETVTDPALRAPGLEALDELEAARDAVRVAASAGDGRVAAALGALDDTFTRLTGSTATRRDGEAYAGRTLVYEDCLRGDELSLGTAALDALREPLALLLEAARWFTAAGAALVHRACLDIYRTRAAELGTNLVPLAEFWLLAQELIFHPPASVIGPLVRNLQDRWARILALPPGERRVTVHSAQLRQQVRDAFVVARPGWAGAVHHSPDLMLCTGDGGWVLGELHPGVNTLRYASRVAYHPDPGLLRRAAAADVGGSAVVLAPSAELGTRARQFNGLLDPGHPWLVFAHDTSGYDPARTLLVGDCDLVEAAGRLVVRHRSGRPPLDLIEVIADAVSMELTQHFKVLPPARHAPRVSLDALVVHRETWTFAPDELPFAGVPDESARFLAIRRWAGEHSLPRYAFVRATGERKPIFIDLASLASADLLSRAVRRARRQPDPVVTVTEMLPAPDQLWLTDAGGAPYTCELRICAVDRRYATSASR